MAESEKILQVAAQAAIGELAARIPGGSTALTVVQAVFRNCTDKRAQELFATIGERIRAEDWDTAAEKLEKNIGQPWFDETIERGFRDIIECVSSEARRCIGFLVSEYLGRQTKPDPTFRKVGWLLRESDETALRTFSEICGMYAELTDAAETGLRVLVRASRRSREPGLFWLAVHKSDSSVLGRRVTEPENLDECVRALVTHRVGNNWTGLSSLTFEGEPILRFNEADDSVFRLLGSCLRALNQQRADVSSAS